MYASRVEGGSDLGVHGPVTYGDLQEQLEPRRRVGSVETNDSSVTVHDNKPALHGRS